MLVALSEGSRCGMQQGNRQSNSEEKPEHASISLLEGAPPLSYDFRETVPALSEVEGAGTLILDVNWENQNPQPPAQYAGRLGHPCPG